jgi:hypothetical protein
MSNRYAIVKGSVVDGIAIADAPLDAEGIWINIDSLDPQPCAGWTYEDGIFAAPKPPAPTKLPNIITKLAFRFRLTDTEYVGILSAAKTDVEVAAWVETFNMVSSVNLDDPRTKSGLDLMVAKTLLTAERKTEILTADVKSEERG